MPCYDYICLMCRWEFERYNVSIDDRDKKQYCLSCGKFSASRIYKKIPKFIISETNSPVSCKEDSYWNNAEQNRLRNLKKAQEEDQEKKFYNG